MAADMLSAGGRPRSALSVMFSPHQQLRVSESHISRSTTSPKTEYQRRSSPHLNPELSSIEVENLLREKVKANYASLLQGFRNYDIKCADSITKGEFRRVLMVFAFPMTTEQFESVVSKVETDKSGSVMYIDFLDKFYGKDAKAKEDWISASYRYVKSPARQPPEVNMDQVEKQVQDKIKSNAKEFIKSFHLFDYNRDGKIQRHDFKKVLDSNSLKLSETQFDKFWLRYDFHHSGVLDYKDFLRKIGVRILQPLHVEDKRASFEVTSKSMNRKEDQVQLLNGTNFDQLDREFRKRMRSNFVNVKKAMAACDRHSDGFISLGDLRAVLSAFTIPMSEQLFSQLMQRADIKANGKVCWGIVLQKFQDPQANGNGQTLPIKPSHKYHPIREADEPASADELWNLLYKHVGSAYGSFKNAFLQLDQNRTGRVTKKDIRKVLLGFKVRLAKEQLNKLMKRLDPENSNEIDYIKFLDIFEPRETDEGHKWLTSEHRYNSASRPLILAWDTVEEILRDKLTDSWKLVANMLNSYDPLSSAMVNQAHLRKIIMIHGIPVSDDHFDYMISKLEDIDGKKVNYVEFLAKLGVDIQPSDLHGLSTQIFNKHNSEQDRRYADQQLRQVQVEQSLQERTQFMTPEEVIVRLRDRMLQHKMGVREAFLSFDKVKNNKISKKNFRKALFKQGMFLKDEQFANLCNQLNFTSDKIDYYQFIDAFDTPYSGTNVENDIKRVGNHRVNEHRGDEFGMTSQQAEDKLRSKLKENFSDLRSAFYKFDADHNGLVSRADFRRMLDAFMIALSDQEFDVLCTRLGLEKKAKICYQDFLDRFEVKDTAEGHKWLWSDHRFNATKEPPLMSADQAHQLIVDKAHRQWKDLSKAFLTLDSNQSGMISKKELRALLSRFIIPITEEEFGKLWKRYDENELGYITHQQFLDKLGVNFAPGDQSGISQRLIDESLRMIDKHHASMVLRHEVQTYNQASTVWNIPVEEIYQKLRDRVRDSYSDFYKAFKAYDSEQTGYVSMNDLHKVLGDLNYFLSDKQFAELMRQVGLPNKGSKLNYEQFLQAFQEGRADNYPPKQDDFTSYKAFENWSPEKAETKLKKYVTEQSAALAAIFQAIDKDNTGRVSVTDFRRVLDAFCFKMTDAQFKSVMNRMKASGEEIRYPAFLDAYQNGPGGESIPFNDKVINELKMPNEGQPGDSFLQQLREAVSRKFYNIARHLAEIDYAKIGVVSRDDFHDVITRHCFRVSPSQFDNLWSILKVNQFGNVDYRDFLKVFSSEAQPLANIGAGDGRQSQGDLRPSSQMTDRELQFSRAQSRAQSRLNSRAGSVASQRQGAVTPMVNAEDIENRIRPAVQRNWKRFQEACRLHDAAGMGEVEASQFKELADRFNFGLEPGDFHRLTLKYDIRNNGKFSYSHFLRQFVLSDVNALGTTERKFLPEPKVPSSPGLTSDQFYEAMIRIKDTILAYWKDMRREFRRIDDKGIGVVSPFHFRNILRQYRVNLSEDEFYHLMTHYDKGMTGNISYNDFIGHFLKSAQGSRPVFEKQPVA